MAKLVLIIAKSGTGKSSSLRNLNPDEAAVVLCSGKDLPFRHELSTIVPNGYPDVITIIRQSKKPIIVIDDANYLMSFDEMSRINEVGYGKFNQMASSMFRVFKEILEKDSDQVFYIMAHAAEDEHDQLRFKTTGKMLSEKVVLEGLTNIVLTTEMVDGEFVFRTQTDGRGVKIPLGMFDTPTIPNDLKLVDEAIRKFYAPAKKAPVKPAAKPAPKQPKETKETK